MLVSRAGEKRGNRYSGEMLITSQKINPDPSSQNLADLLVAPQYLAQGEELMLECWTCARRRKLDPTMYRYGRKFILREAADGVKWITANDFRRQRVLAFCSERCKRDAQTKKGLFKLNRPRPK
jgi:hypothetical protein